MNQKQTTTVKEVDNHSFMQEIRKLFNEGNRKSVTFIVKGVSMRPFLESGRDKVVLAPPRTPRIGDVVLAEIRKETYALHRVIKIEGDTYTMRGDGNPLWMTETFREADIVGVADAFIRKGKLVPTTSYRWRWYSTFWRAMTPVRRILLAIYRRI